MLRLLSSIKTLLVIDVCEPAGMEAALLSLSSESLGTWAVSEDLTVEFNWSWVENQKGCSFCTLSTLSTASNYFCLCGQAGLYEV